MLRKKAPWLCCLCRCTSEDVEERFTPYQCLHQEVLQAERMTMIQMRNQGTINDEVLHRLEREFDLEEEQLKR